MKKLVIAAMVYTALGLAGGLLFREATKSAGPNGEAFTGHTELAVVHTHLLVLGLLVMLIVLALDKLFALSGSKVFGWFFWVYNAGLVVTVTMMVIIGFRQIDKPELVDTPAALAGIAGLGHILLTAALVLFFVSLYPAVTKGEKPAVAREIG
ncbi:DUF2871 domain-containing protein [Nakamurella lactea]|uniref:DUF2871 domain-containing protein n=1 Tax=Nakamurella lactea TaxID=459515 RepID=UPI000426114D|nr:DUF2871 domain-containing protein [Nakamurella lactea]